jgi:hypothetical protein
MAGLEVRGAEVVAKIGPLAHVLKDSKYG